MMGFVVGYSVLDGAAKFQINIDHRTFEFRITNNA
jgi:hypothetical protein